MRLLMVSASMDCGGAETHIYALGEGLRKRGHQVVIASGGGRLAEEWVQFGGEHVEIPLKRSPRGLCVSFFKLWVLLGNRSFDVIHVHGRLSGLLCFLLSELRGIPMVGTVHARFRVGALRGICRWGNRSIAVSEDLKQYLWEEYGVPLRQIRVIYNGVDTRRFCPAATERTGGYRILFLSRLDRDCSLGAFLLCDLAEELCEKTSAPEIYIAGDGVCRGELERRAEQINQRMGRRVILLLGHVSQPEEIFRQVDVFVGVSRSALEAMACGIPVLLGGNEGWIGVLSPERLTMGEQSNFCCRGERRMTRALLQSALEEVFSQTEEQRAIWGAKLREYVCRHHSVERMAQETEEVYKAVTLASRSEGGVTLLCGYYGFGNLGDDTLLYVAIQRVREKGGNPVALTKKGRRDAPSIGIPCIHRLWLPGIIRQLRHVQCLVLGGGTLLQENTSKRSLWYYTMLIHLAARRGIPVELWANGLGVPKSRWGAKRMKNALLQCQRIGFRDIASCQIAECLMGDAPHPPFRWEKDLAMETVSCSDARKEYLLRYYGLGKKTTYAVAVVHGGVKRGYLKSFMFWMETLLEQRIELLLVPMYPAEDEALCRSLGRRWHCRVVRGLSAEDLVGLMEESCVVCGMRLHALVLAHCAGAPFVGFGGDSKVRSFCREWGGVYFTDLYGKGREGEIFYFG